MKPLFAVVFTDQAPTELFFVSMTTVALRDGREALAMNCTEFAETSLGFLRLVPKQEGEKPPMALYVRQEHVLLAMQIERASDFGFQPAS